MSNRFFTIHYGAYCTTVGLILWHVGTHVIIQIKPKCKTIQIKKTNGPSANCSTYLICKTLLFYNPFCMIEIHNCSCCHAHIQYNIRNNLKIVPNQLSFYYQNVFLENKLETVYLFLDFVREYMDIYI